MRKLWALVALVIVVPMLGACSVEDSAINEVGLIYGGGLIEEKSFKGVFDPGQTASVRMGMDAGDSIYRYRIDQRTFIFEDAWEQEQGKSCDQRSADSPPLQVVSNDNVRMSVDGALYMTLRWDDIDTDGGSLRQFHERLGVKTEAWKCEGWLAMLNQYFKPQLVRAAETAALKHTWEDLYTSEETRRQFAADTTQAFDNLLTEVVGGNYFCGPKHKGPDTECDSFTLAIGKPRPPQALVDSLELVEAARKGEIAQTQENARIAAQVAGEEALVRLYGPLGAAIIKAIQAGNVQFMVIPSDANVTVPPPRQQ